MNIRRGITNLTTILLLIATVVCVITGIIKWPGLLNVLDLTYRQLPMTLITDLHDWSGLVMVILAGIHVFQFRARMKRITRGIFP